EALLQLGVMADSDEEGIQLFERAVRLKPKLSLDHYRLGLAYQRLGNAEKAKEEVDLFRKLKAEDVEAQRRSVLESLRCPWLWRTSQQANGSHEPRRHHLAIELQIRV